MKSKIVIYLFVFTALILIFQLVNSSKVVKYQADTIKEKLDRIKILKDELDVLQAAYEEDVYFSLDQNEEAQAFFSENDASDIINRVKDEIYASNAVKGNNPLVPFTGYDRKFLINKVKVINHKWVIADFSDGTDWGEMWMRYEIEGEKIRLVVLDQILYLND